jgi:branched-chain amino acid transport system substrate-binding protein
MRHSKWKLLSLVGITLLGAAPVRAEVLIGLSAPLTGTYAWAGIGAEEGAEMAVADLNGKGGVLGASIEMITVDDYCDGAQAVAAAQKLIIAEVAAAFGPVCSGAAIPVSRSSPKPVS